MFLLEIADAEHQVGNAIGVIDREQPLAKLAGIVDVAVAEHRQESAAQQIRIARIELEHVHVIGGFRSGIALFSGVPGGEIAAERVVWRQVRRHLNSGRLRQR